jgi:hypothetical protein
MAWISDGAYGGEIPAQLQDVERELQNLAVSLMYEMIDFAWNADGVQINSPKSFIDKLFNIHGSFYDKFLQANVESFKKATDIMDMIASYANSRRVLLFCLDYYKLALKKGMHRAGGYGDENEFSTDGVAHFCIELMQDAILERI